VADNGKGGGLDSFFSQKYGPLPAWAWLGIAAGGGFLYIRYRNKKAATSTAASTSTTAGAAQGFDYGPSYAAIQSEIQGLQAGYGQLSQNASSSSASTNLPPHTLPPGWTPPPRTRPAQPSPFVPSGQGTQQSTPTAVYLQGGYPGAGAQQGVAYNFSASQLQQMNFPNLRGLSVGQAQTALANYAGGSYKVNNVSGNPQGRIVSYTPYSSGQVNLGVS
jgi:hypothetical protein